MSNNKKGRVLKCNNYYIVSSFPFNISEDITRAKNYYGYSWLMVVMNNLFNGIECSIKKTLSMSMDFDAKIETMLGGTKGFVSKLLLSFIRKLEKIKRYLEAME